MYIEFHCPQRTMRWGLVFNRLTVSRIPQSVLLGFPRHRSVLCIILLSNRLRISSPQLSLVTRSSFSRCLIHSSLTRRVSHSQRATVSIATRTARCRVALTPSRFSQQTKPPPPPPIDIEGEPQYEVEEVRDSQRHRGHLQYLVHWKGYSQEEDTWEPMSHLSHAPEHVHEFHTKYPDKPSPTNNIRILNISPDQRQQLFNPITNTPGINFTMTTPHQTSSNDDIIISLPQNTVDKIFTEGIHVFRFPWWYFPPIPPLTKWVWIYEPSPIQSITCVACFDPVSQHPVGLYQLINPPSKEVLRGRYDFQTKLIPAVAPAWLVRDYGKQVLRVW